MKTPRLSGASTRKSSRFMKPTRSVNGYAPLFLVRMTGWFISSCMNKEVSEQASEIVSERAIKTILHGGFKNKEGEKKLPDSWLWLSMICLYLGKSMCSFYGAKPQSNINREDASKRFWDIMIFCLSIYVRSNWCTQSPTLNQLGKREGKKCF